MKLLLFFLLFPMLLEAQDLTIIKGVVTDGANGNILAAEIKIFDAKTNESISTFHANSETGKYLVSLPLGKKYLVVFSYKGYSDYTTKINCRRKKGYKQIIKDIELLVDPETLVKSIKKSDVEKIKFGTE